jgi:hypothetical protein
MNALTFFFLFFLWFIISRFLVILKFSSRRIAIIRVPASLRVRRCRSEEAKQSQVPQVGVLER